MVRAIEAVKDGKMGVKHAAKEHSVPRTTLKDRLSGKVEHGKKSGPIPYLNSKEEELATFLKEASRIGYGKTKREVLLIVQKILEQKGSKPECFNGEGWYHRFMLMMLMLGGCSRTIHIASQMNSVLELLSMYTAHLLH